jgi:YidC/Oxa1 family membrane protein insertase
MFDFLFDGIASALAFLYDATGSYAASIMLLTLGVMFIVTPLTLKSTRSMIAMQQLQPELRKLQAKYKDDRQKLNEEMMAFYKEHNISPLGGCLPLIVQTPVFIVLYQVLIGLTRPHSYGEDMGRAAGLLIRNPDGGGFYENFGTFDPKYLEHSTNLYQDLSKAREMLDFGGGLDLADTLTQRLSDGGFVHALPYIVLVAIVAVSAWFQQRQIMARNAGSQAQINPQQQALMKIMPFFLPIFSVTLPAGIVLYFVVSNGYRIIQQGFITRTMYSEDAKAARAAELKAKGLDVDVPARSDTVPEGKKGLFGGLIQLPDRDGASTNGSGKGSSGKGKVDMTKSDDRRAKTGPTPKRSAAGSTKKASTPTKKKASSPNRQAPSRTAPASASNQNRSKNKKKRK